MRLIYGRAINDVEGKTTLHHKGKIYWRCPYYSRWLEMIRRCLSVLEKQRQSNCLESNVCEEWLKFSAFKSWMKGQQWKDLQLDKDLLGDGRLYSPETCSFIPSYLNCFFSSEIKRKRNFLLGVSPSKTKGKFYSRCRMGGTYKNLGTFTTEEDAHFAWVKAKRAELLRLTKIYKQSLKPDQRVVDRLDKIIDKFDQCYISRTIMTDIFI